MPLNFLGPLSPRRQSQFSFGAYDIETQGKNDLTFVMIGLYNGKDYFCFRNLRDFFNEVTKPRYNEWRFFAHFGGRFDVHYLFDWMRENAPDARFEFFCVGSAVISFTLSTGGDRWIRFTDSYRLLPKSLETLTKEFDVEHKKLPFAPLDWKYNRHDCLGLHEVLQAFFGAHDLSSETVAAHAMRLFRTRYLHQVIPRHRPAIEPFIRECYHGGRCEIYRFDSETVNKFDVNSLYPFAMTMPVPVEYLCETRDLPDDDGRVGFYQADIEYPEVYVPCLPCRLEKLYFPVGRWTGHFTSLDLRQAISDGASVRIRKGYLFHAEPMLAEYVHDLHLMKQEAEVSGNSGRRYVAKLLMNSLYGKFGQRRERRAFCTDPGTDRLYSHPEHPKLWPIPKEPGLAFYFIESRSPHILPHIAATVTSRARLILLQYLREPERIWYTDTDSLFTTAELAAGNELGSMKYEGSGKFQAWQLKEYTFDGKIQLKGVPMTRIDDETGEKVRDEALARAYCDGWELHLPRMAGFVESITQGLPTVRSIMTRRRRRFPREKRAREGVFDTRPWNIKELNQ